MTIQSFDQKLAYKEIQLRVLPPKERGKWIEHTPENEVRKYGKANVPFGLIQMFRHRIGEMNRENLDAYELGRIRIVEGDDVEAENLLETGLKQGDERACGNLGILKEKRGDVKKAIRLYERGKDSSSKNSLGNYLARKKEYEKARAAYDEAMDLSMQENNPGAGAVAINIGKIFAEIGATPTALVIFAEATKLGYFEGYMEAYKVAAEMENWDLVRTILYQASSVSYGPAIIQSALMLLEQGENQKAKDMFDLAENLGYTLSDEQKKIILMVRAATKNAVGTG